ncbi:MAG: amidohydrolase [Anaerolineae bacterium CG_4_9_14_3_um_filter_57_17]|nr:amidohydrolase [bacterium]NCT20800.1 amidohydrolase [bacterium]OIO84150.1 MAG: hypothetical protein AUK01_10310 [Anaerolineae bacterium CG2_30_57_67]PJB68657.1 MAG: amidohydrolase [Anaerolineae bacterium CG_4_9_14_3_um_filter_57_17]
MKIFHNARIYTLDPRQPMASALAVEAGRVLAVGGEELPGQAPLSAAREDLGGRVILPGLTDAHIHLMHYALSLQKVDVETASLAAALRRVAERAALAAPGTWILGHGWQQNDWGGDFPAAADLDSVAPRNPVYLSAKSLHAGWANSVALRAAGITADTPDPHNGKILRDARGQPTGILLESAMSLLEKALPQPSAAEAARAIAAALPVLHGFGLTGAHDFDYRTAFQALQLLNAQGKLALRVTKSIPVDLLPHAHALGLRTGFGDDFLRIGSVKAFMDGALGPRTAAMLEPYLNEPENRGILNLDGEELFEIGRQAAESGLSLAVHAIGDRAVHEALAAFARLRGYERENGLPALRHRIEHVQLIHPADARRLAELGVIASMQPIHATSDMFAAGKYWGARAELSYAWKTQQAAGATLAFGSDAPVESPNPFWGIHAAVTRRRPDGAPAPAGWISAQRLDFPAALAGFTTGAAYAAGAESHQGRLAPGFFADFITLERDPFQTDSAALRDFRPCATCLAGEWVWQS